MDAEDVIQVLDALSEAGVRHWAGGGWGVAALADWLPARVELRAPGDRWVDVHPVTFDECGRGRQAGLHGEFSITRRTPSAAD